MSFLIKKKDEEIFPFLKLSGLLRIGLLLQNVPSTRATH
jgi:hypothetical protein